jgi:hypothetical protein
MTARHSPSLVRRVLKLDPLKLDPWMEKKSVGVERFPSGALGLNRFC